MGDFSNVYRKIVSWNEVVRDPEYRATLECGHTIPGPYEDGLPKDVREKMGAQAICIECTREERELAEAEERVRAIKARRKRPPPSGGNGEG